MGDITTSRTTLTRNEGIVHRNLTIASGETIYHGTVAGFDSDGNVKSPGAGVRGYCIALVPDGNSAAAGERCDLLECDALLDILSGATVNAALISQVVFAASNHEVSDDTADGEPLGTLTGIESSKAWVSLRVGVPLVVDTIA